MIDMISVEAEVRAIIDEVTSRGDEAVIEYGVRFDGLPQGSGIAVMDRSDLKLAAEAADPELTGALGRAAENIRAFHSLQVQDGYEISDMAGRTLGQRIRGLDRVGIYVPGGTASYPSTVLMNAIPAKLAGVGEIIMATPPGASPAVLAAAYIAGVDRVFLIGGAQAIAAMSCGTETIPRVDKIVGPGNIYVATAKRLVFGRVDIDMVAGPSEILIIADESADPVYIAADMLSQAEHDEMAAATLLTTSEALADKVRLELDLQLEALSRNEIAASSLKNNGGIIVCDSIDDMIGRANDIAPEHLELLVDEPLGLIDRIRNAGTIFCGPYSPEPLGDYYAGTNHVLPTSGTARWASPLGVYDFIKRTAYISYTLDSLRSAAGDIAVIGLAEGLDAHVAAVNKRL